MEALTAAAMAAKNEAAMAAMTANEGLSRVEQQQNEIEQLKEALKGTAAENEKLREALQQNEAIAEIRQRIATMQTSSEQHTAEQSKAVVGKKQE